MYHAAVQSEALIRLYPLVFPADNPMQAEEACGAALNSSHNCRQCHAGGTKDYKVSEEGYGSLFMVCQRFYFHYLQSDSMRRTQAAQSRTIDETIDQIFYQYIIAMEASAKEHLATAIRMSGTKDSTAYSIMEHLLELGVELRSKDNQIQKHDEATVQGLLQAELFKRKDNVINPLVSIGSKSILHRRRFSHLSKGKLGVDVHRDTPVEILHTVLLGVVKYFWAQTVTILEEKGLLGTLRARLASIDDYGLAGSRLVAEYVIQYKGALIGKHFKALVQIMAFVVFDLVHDDLIKGWLALGQLTVLLWYTESDSMEIYKVRNEFLA